MMVLRPFSHGLVSSQNTSSPSVRSSTRLRAPFSTSSMLTDPGQLPWGIVVGGTVLTSSP